MMLDVTNWITRNNLRFAYILLYPKDRTCVIGNDSATRKRFMKFLINISMYSLTQRNYLNNIKLTPWQTYRTWLPNCFSSSHLFMFFSLIESRKFVLFQEQLLTSVIGLHFCVWLSSKSKWKSRHYVHLKTTKLEPKFWWIMFCSSLSNCENFASSALLKSAVAKRPK